MVIGWLQLSCDTKEHQYKRSLEVMGEDGKSETPALHTLTVLVTSGQAEQKPESNPRFANYSSGMIGVWMMLKTGSFNPTITTVLLLYRWCMIFDLVPFTMS